MSEDRKGQAKNRRRGQEISAVCSGRERTGRGEMGEQERNLLNQSENGRKYKGNREQKNQQKRRR